MMRKLRIAAGVILLSCGFSAFHPATEQRRRGHNPPRLVLWAWERPEDLGFIDPQDTAVAYLADSIFISEQGITSHPRLQPLALPAGTERIAVVRIESRNLADALPGLQLSKRLVDECCELVVRERVKHLQIDYDARVSERPFYHDLLTRLRAILPQGTYLSITALTSWCLGDPWIADLPIDEAVPMAFRMGRDGAAVRNFLKTNGSFDLPVCRGSLGISLDEMPPLLPKHKRLYVFNPKPWTARDVAALQKEN
jgi:hypothetical protein